MSMTTILLFGLVVLVTHFLEGITGFGCTALALPFCIIIVGVKAAVPVLVVLAWLLALYVIIIDFKNIAWEEFLNIAIFVGLGLPVGMILFSYLPESALKKILGVFMIIVSIRGLYISFGKNILPKPMNKYLLDIILFFGGIIHGAFGSGGPFVVIYATRALPDKSKFRATLCTLWFSLNSIIIFKDIRGGAMTSSVLYLLACMVPFLIVGMIIGNIAHHKIKDTVFTKIVYGVLFASGIFMLI